MDNKELGDKEIAAYQKKRLTYNRTLIYSFTTISLLPFIVICLTLIFIGSSHPLSQKLGDVFVILSIVAIAFFAGIRWSAITGILDEASNDTSAISPLALTAISAPIFSSCLLIFVEMRYALPILLVIHAGLGAWDSLSGARGEMSAWYGRLRIIQTLALAICHILVLVFH